MLVVELVISSLKLSVADPGYPVGRHQPRGGHQLPTQLHFVKFVLSK